MYRIAPPPRADRTELVESQGLLFHAIDGVPYRDEGADDLLEAMEVDWLDR